MANGAKEIYQRDNLTTEDVNGSSVNLKNCRVVEGLHTPIISLTQLMKEGWTMQSKYIGLCQTKPLTVCLLLCKIYSSTVSKPAS